MRSFLRILLPLMAASLLGGCAGMARHEPLQVMVAGVEPLQGEGLELRMLVKLRVQNPNDAPLDFDGVFVRLDVQDRTFASGVSDERGSVPRFGEAVIAVPVTVSVMRMVRQALGMLDGKPVDRVRYELYGRLNGPAFRSVRFRSAGEFDVPSREPTQPL